MRDKARNPSANDIKERERERERERDDMHLNREMDDMQRSKIERARKECALTNLVNRDFWFKLIWKIGIFFHFVLENNFTFVLL